MVSMFLKPHGYAVFNTPLNFKDSFAWSHTCSIRHPKNMRINCLSRMIEANVQDNIGCFAPHARKRFQCGTRRRNLAVILFQQYLRQLEDIFGLVLVKTDSLYACDESLLTQLKHVPRSIRHRKKLACGQIDPHIGRLSRQNHGHQKRVCIQILKFSSGFRVSLGKPLKSRFDCFIINLLIQFTPYVVYAL